MNLCKKDKCTKVPVETTQYVEQKQCLPFELDLAHMSAHHGDPCASYDQGVINAQVFFFYLQWHAIQTALLPVYDVNLSLFEIAKMTLKMLQAS